MFSIHSSPVANWPGKKRLGYKPGNQRFGELFLTEERKIHREEGKIHSE
jgi:hypothetical protein